MNTTFKQKGFSLIELMISITISIFVLLILSDFFISIFNSSKLSEAKVDNEKEIMFILGKVKSSLQWAGYSTPETLADMTQGQALLSDAAFDDVNEIFPTLNINNCNFNKGSAVTTKDNKILCLRNYLPPTSNSSIYTNVDSGKPNWMAKKDNADMLGILSCSGAFYFSSIYNSLEKQAMLITKITKNDDGQLTCDTFIANDASKVKTYVSSSDVKIDSLYFSYTKNSVEIDLTVSSGKNVLLKDCTYTDPSDDTKTLSTNSKKLCTTVTQTIGLIK